MSGPRNRGAPTSCPSRTAALRLRRRSRELPAAAKCPACRSALVLVSMFWPSPALLTVVIVSMALEAAVSARHAAVLRARGGTEPAGDVYWLMAVVYPTAFLVM